MWTVLDPRREAVRVELAREYQCDPEELALVRNASEGLEICQLGIDLAEGDEILTTNQDYPRMLATFRQRERREGVKLVLISIPTPCTDPAEIVARFERAITPRTKLMLACHMINLTGQILPVRELAALARRRGVPLIVDGAHALAHFPFTLAELECDYYATSLHKWMAAPIGTGLLYVRREKIAGLWPLMGAPAEMAGDIRKFEEIGTNPVGHRLAIGDALAFHREVGPARKAARLVHLRDFWARRLLAQSERVRLHTSLAPGFACAIATFAVDGLPAAELQGWLWSKHQILTTPIQHAEFEGLRVSPSVYTHPAELERFCEAVERALAQGLR
jgi:selenocysteine lyase/cysteine desulfurase